MHFQVVSLHSASEKFMSLIPLLTCHEELEIAGTEVEEECQNLPLYAKQRMLAGIFIEFI